MTKFFLIQRGIFLKDGKSLFGSNRIIELDYMGSAEFECGALPNAHQRLMSRFSEYDTFHTGVYSPENDELMVFCKKQYKTEIIKSICQFIEKPYALKEYSNLEEIPKVKKKDLTYGSTLSNFWWCIDIEEPCGDWMAFFQSNLLLFMEAIQNDYQNWIIRNSHKKRKSFLHLFFRR